MSQSKTIIFSDLDGTLLDHFTYESTEVDEVLIQLKRAGIPVILNTSKTFAEVEFITKALNLDTPFIVENGAAIFIPIGTFDQQPSGTVIIGKYWVKSFGFPRRYWIELLNRCQQFNHLFQGFDSISVSKLAGIAGLSIEEATRAKQRQYGEPLQWLGDESQKLAFIEHLVSLGANVIQGGRFIHVGDFCDKGQALIWLTELYRKHHVNESISTIALGDGENDVPMLDVADIAVQIRSPSHKFPKLNRQPIVIKTQQIGPKGWAETIQDLLSNQLLSTTER